MTVSTVGAILLALSSTGIGIWMGEREKRKAKDCLFFFRLSCHLHKEIVYRKCSLSDCFLSFDGISDMGTHEKFLIHTLAKGEYDAAMAEAALPLEVKKELAVFWKELGKGNILEEDVKCKAIMQFLKDRNQIQKEQTANSVKVFKTLGGCIGAVLLLLLI